MVVLGNGHICLELKYTACACTVHTKIIFNSPQSSLILRYGLYLCNMYSVKYTYRAILVHRYVLYSDTRCIVLLEFYYVYEYL